MNRMESWSKECYIRKLLKARCCQLQASDLVCDDHHRAQARRISDLATAIQASKRWTKADSADGKPTPPTPMLNTWDQESGCHLTYPYVKTCVQDFTKPWWPLTSRMEKSPSHCSVDCSTLPKKIRTQSKISGRNGHLRHAYTLRICPYSMEEALSIQSNVTYNFCTILSLEPVSQVKQQTWRRILGRLYHSRRIVLRIIVHWFETNSAHTLHISI